jgi:hypothetical protein
VRKHLGSDVELRPYEDIFPYLRFLSEQGKARSL